MADWKFTDEYLVDYPALDNSILSVLVFDVDSGSPIDGTSFKAPLDLTASGTSLNVLSIMLGMTSIPVEGTVTTTDDTLNVSLYSTNNDDILAALADCLPLIGGSILQSASITIVNSTPANYTVEDDPVTDTFDINTTIAIGEGTGSVVTQVPLSSGMFTMSATFSGFGITLSDLDFLVPDGTFTEMFPTTLPEAYYNPETTSLSLLSLELSLHVATSPSLDVSVGTVTTSIGIENLALLPDALFLNPLAVWVSITDPYSNPVASWGLTASVMLYPFGEQTNPPTAEPDFTFELDMEMPVGDSTTLTVDGEYSNPENLAVSRIICDLMNDGSYDTGIASTITLETFDFSSVADTSTGTVSEFVVDVGMSATNNGGTYVGLFTSSFGVQDFSITVTYEG